MRARHPDGSLLLLVPALIAGLALSAGCPRSQGGGGDRPLDTVDVTAKPDAEANLETDVVAAPHPDETGVAGVLPADFPKDVPLPQPSSLVDFGPRRVTVEIQTTLASARASYLDRLRANGFAESAGEWRKGARRIGVSFGENAGAARITIEVF